MERVRLNFQEVRWSAEGGPVALLRVGSGDDYLALDLAAEEAWALVAAPQHERAGRIRLGSTLVTLSEGAGACLQGVRLVVGQDGLLRAELTVGGAQGTQQVLVHVADGLLLARQSNAPLTIAASYLAGHHSGHTPSPPAAQPSGAADPLHLFREVIAGLDWPEANAPQP